MEEYSEEYPEESTNRSFVIASIALGGIFVAGMLALGLYLFKVKPARLSANATQIAEINASNTEVALAAEATAGAQMIIAEAAHVVAARATTAPPIDDPTVAPTEDPTPAATDTHEPAAVLVAPAAVLVAPAAFAGNVTGNVSDASTGSANDESNEYPTAIPIVEVAPAALPNTGFMDEVGLPMLLFAALGLMVLIIVTRAIRHITRSI